MGYGVSQSERASPAAAKDVHLAVDIEFTAEPQHVIDQMSGRVVGERRGSVVVACARCAFATATLVEKNDPVSLRIEKVGKKLPDYTLSSAITAWYKTGTYGCFCGFEDGALDARLTQVPFQERLKFF
jgi:hypothetical protein